MAWGNPMSQNRITSDFIKHSVDQNDSNKALKAAAKQASEELQRDWGCYRCGEIVIPFITTKHGVICHLCIDKALDELGEMVKEYEDVPPETYN